MEVRHPSVQSKKPKDPRKWNFLQRMRQNSTSTPRRGFSHEIILHFVRYMWLPESEGTFLLRLLS